MAGTKENSSTVRMENRVYDTDGIALFVCR